MHSIAWGATTGKRRLDLFATASARATAITCPAKGVTRQLDHVLANTVVDTDNQTAFRTATILSKINTTFLYSIVVKEQMVIAGNQIERKMRVIIELTANDVSWE
jgi:hypothetical protein